MARLGANGLADERFVYATGINVPAYMVKGGATYRLITDHLGSVRLVVNTATGAIAQRLDYDTFGRVLLDTNPGFQPFGYAGGLYDADTGLVRFGARDYDAETGRWTAKDPLGLGGGTNAYAYAAGQPVDRVDPDGLLSARAQLYVDYARAVGPYSRPGYDRLSKANQMQAINNVLTQLRHGQHRAFHLADKFLFCNSYDQDLVDADHYLASYAREYTYPGSMLLGGAGYEYAKKYLSPLFGPLTIQRDPLSAPESPFSQSAVDATWEGAAAARADAMREILDRRRLPVI